MSEILKGEYLVKRESLSAIADAIRSRSGAMGKKLNFPDGFVDEVTAISSEDDGRLRAVIERTITNIVLPDNLTKIGVGAFDSCYNLVLTSLPDGVTSIGASAFLHCYNLALTSLPSGLTSIERYGFTNCPKLAIKSIPSGVTSIGDGAFSDCTGLTILTFKGKPSSIESKVFKGCTNLTTINVPWAEGAVANAPWGATNATINYNYTGEA